jgi:DNA polymerase-1
MSHRKEQKQYSTYVKGLRKRVYRGRVYPTFNLHIATTGRLSSRNPNMQNITRSFAIKKQFIPASENNLFVQADYSQAELRVLAWLANDKYLLAVLGDPTRDLFDELTPILYPALGAKENVPADVWKETRVRVKAFVYGLGYGRTPFSIAAEYRLSEEEAKAVAGRFMELIPDVVAWQRDVKKRVYAGEDLISPFGRHRRFHLITKENWKSVQNEALAFLPQSTSSDVCLRAMVRVRRDLRGSGAFVRNIVHDSILVDTPSDMAEHVAGLLDSRMVESGRELVGDAIAFATECKIGTHWGEV